MPKVNAEDDVSTIICSAGVLADMLGIKDTTVRHLASSGVMPRVSSGRYKMRDCVHNYVMQLRMQSKSTSQPSSSDLPELKDAQAKHEVIKTHIAEIRLDVMRGKVHKSEDVERVMTNMLASVRSKLLSIPSKVAPRVAAMNDAGEVMAFLQTEIYEALHELSEYSPEMFYGDDLALDEDGNPIELESTVSDSDTEVVGDG